MAAKRAPKAKADVERKALCACCRREMYSYDETRYLCGGCNTSREQYAQAAMGTLVGQYDAAISPQLAQQIADDAFTLADAMLRRAKGPYAYAGEP